MDIKIIIATHKTYWMPDDPMYIPVHVGAEGKTDSFGVPLDLGYVKDNTGDNISSKNVNYCELTGLYWAWKNLDAEYIGLAHYRRHFSSSSNPFIDKKIRVINHLLLKKILEEAGVDILLPNPRNYWIETNYSQYVHAHPREGLDLALELAGACGDSYAAAAEGPRKRSWTHLFNMFIMKRELFDAYCSWLFPILFQMEARLDLTGWSDNDRRVFGFVAERLLDVWLEANEVSCREIPVMFMENQNWLIKGGRFVKRKILPAKGN